MDHADHVRLIRAGVEGATDGPWLDLGAGTGAFTLALADLLGPDGLVVAVDRDAGDLSENARRVRAAYPATRVTTLAADFTRPLHLGLEVAPAGLVLANALHFVARAEQVRVLRSLAGLLRPGGRCVIVEYDADHGKTWVPYPQSVDRRSNCSPGG